MIGFARLITSLRSPASRVQTLARYLETAPPDAARTALDLLSGNRPKALASRAEVTGWLVAASGFPAWLIDASLAASGDFAETAALLLPPPDPQTLTPGLAQTVALLRDLHARPKSERSAAVLALWAQLPIPSRIVLNRLVLGQMRLTLTETQLAEAQGAQPVMQATRTITALLIMASQTAAPGQTAPDLSFALRHGNTLVPLTRLPAALPPDQARALAQWVRANMTQKFGPQLSVPAVQVFDLAFDGLIPNRRKKCGFDLINPRLIAWRRDATADAANDLTALKIPNPP